ncbi:MAG: iron ABC transporter permease [Bacteroidia bacterium]|nr:iron ABC transporter permease [Bacteroidia bacterium]
MPASRSFVFYFILLVISIIAALANIFFGSAAISFPEIFDVLLGRSTDPAHEIIIWKSRVPTALIAWIAGAALSVSGLLMQTLFKNPVAGPYILGISSGAGLGVAILLLSGSLIGSTFLLSDTAILISAAAGSSVVFLMILAISIRISDMTILLVVGLMIAGTIGAVISILQSVGSKEGLQMFVFWSFGSFRNVSLDKVQLLVPFLLLGFLLAVGQIKSLNSLLLGDLSAKNLGVDIKRSKVIIIVSTCLLAGGVTAFCGPIAFIGLAVPHLARMAFNTADHKILIPSSILIGATVACLCSILSSAPWANWTLPLNAVTSLMGAPFVIWILFRMKKIRVYG